MNPTDPRYSQQFQRLLDIVNQLRTSCPWDKVQTWASLRQLTIEEVYELSDALFQKDTEAVKKELGDVLLHIIFYSKIAHEQQAFDIGDVLEAICDKLIYRHPHVFGDDDADNIPDAKTVQANWERLKLKEQRANNRSEKPSVLSGVPAGLPALIKAWRIQQKVAGVGFDWQHRDDVWAKVQEELAEFSEHVNGDLLKNPQEAEQELGDVFFSLVNYARFIGIDPETALEKTNRKFIRRFGLMEDLMHTDGIAVDQTDIEQMEAYWQQAKQREG